MNDTDATLEGADATLEGADATLEGADATETATVDAAGSISIYITIEIDAAGDP